MTRRKPSAWAKFVSVTKNRKPVSYIHEAAGLLGKRGAAVDLGCGAGVDTRHLAEIGFQVTAIDNDSAALRSTAALCSGLSVEIKRKDIRKVRLPPRSVNLVIAWNSLPFLREKDMKRLVRAIRSTLLPDGIFIFSLFGPDDAWAKTRGDMSFVTAAGFKDQLRDLRLIEMRESWREGPTAMGETKFWHKVQGMARKQSV